eukprot:bmy_17680T0
MEGQAALPSWLSRCPFLGAPGEAQHTQAGEGRVVWRQKEKLQPCQAEAEAEAGLRRRRRRRYFELQCRQYKRKMLLARHSLDQDPLREIPDTYILSHLPHLWLPFPSALIRVTARLLFITSFASHAHQTLLEFPGPPGAWLPFTSHLHPASPRPRLPLPRSPGALTSLTPTRLSDQFLGPASLLPQDLNKKQTQKELKCASLLGQHEAPREPKLRQLQAVQRTRAALTRLQQQTELGDQLEYSERREQDCGRARGPGSPAAQEPQSTCRPGFPGPPAPCSWGSGTT